MENNNIEQTIWIEGLKNAIKFNGKAQRKAIMSKLGRELGSRIREYIPIIDKILEQINKMSLVEQKERLLTLDPTALEEREKIREKKELPALKNVDKRSKVIMRLAPYPSGALHIGNARMVVLNDEYIKKYNGELILFYDDTIGSPKAKQGDVNSKYVLPEAYDLIREGLEWLDVKYHKTLYKSDRLEIYYDHCQQLLENGKAYVCLCEAKEFRESYKKLGKECPHRNKEPETNLDDWDKMLNGTYKEMEAVVRLKTGMDQKDPALRDHIMLRISDAEHPKVGTKYRVWPTLEFSWGIDDHLIGATHILRGADLRKEGIIQKMIWDFFKWEHCELMYYGRIKFPDRKLSKTQSRNKIVSGEYSGWHDPRTWSLQSLEKRGIKPEALRETLLSLGLSEGGITFSDAWLYAKNKELIDSTSDRYFFVKDPVRISINRIPFEVVSAEPLILPSNPEKGKREIKCYSQKGELNLYLALEDVEKLNVNDKLRLKDLFNIQINEILPKDQETKEIKSTYSSKPLNRELKIIHWVPKENNLRVKVLRPYGKIDEGYGEINLLNVPMNRTIQFERYGFVNPIELKENVLFCYFTH